MKKSEKQQLIKISVFIDSGYLGMDFHYISLFRHSLSHHRYNRFPHFLELDCYIDDIFCDQPLHKKLGIPPIHQNFPNHRLLLTKL